MSEAAEETQDIPSELMDEANAYFNGSEAEPESEPVDESTDDDLGDVEDLEADDVDDSDEPDEAAEFEADIDLDEFDKDAVIVVEGKPLTVEEIGKGMHRLDNYHRKMTELDRDHKAKIADLEAREASLPDASELDSFRQFKDGQSSDAGRLSLIQKLASEITDSGVNSWFMQQVFPRLQDAGAFNEKQYEAERLKAENERLKAEQDGRLKLQQIQEANKAARPQVRQSLEGEGVQMPDDDWDSFFVWHEDRYMDGIQINVQESLELWQSRQRKEARSEKTRTKTPTPARRRKKKPVDEYSLDNRLAIAREIEALGANA